MKSSRSSKRSHRRSNKSTSSTAPSYDITRGGAAVTLDCLVCQTNIPSTVDYVINQPCHHIICLLCTIKSQVERGCLPQICPVANCRCFTKEIEYIHCDNKGTKENTTEILRNPNIGNENYVKQHLPVHWLKQRHNNELMESSSNEGIVISCTKIQRNDEDGKFEKKTITSTFVLSHKVGTPIEVLDQDRALSEVGNIFAFLHGPIVVPSNPNNLHLPVLSPREIVEMRCHTPQLLDRAVHAMAKNC